MRCLPVAILAGGLATRLRPLTATIPKSLIEVSGSPFIFHQLKWLKKQGAYKIVICLGFLGEQIEALVGNGDHLGLSIEYSYDGEQLLGTGGAIKKALPLLEENFFVLYGDSYLSCSLNDIQSAFEKQPLPALMTVLKNNNCWDKSNVCFQDNILIQYEKKKPNNSMAYIDYGLSILSKKIFNSHHYSNTFDLAYLFTQLSLEQNLMGLEMHQRFYEIGSHTGLEETQNFLIQHIS
ncbi:MAG: nucleotidyltransferase family protein [Pseudomonadota bacterium]